MFKFWKRKPAVVPDSVAEATSLPDLTDPGWVRLTADVFAADPTSLGPDCLGVTVRECERSLLDRILDGEPVWEGAWVDVSAAHQAHIRSALAVVTYSRTGVLPERVVS
ncbi:hypothetical protein [Sanguibacter massiliensis]|uniref:hypothetical protein n=1 Tax=Sanguibacter massiliensis TaxID=1973217 RepID=UPI000C82A2C6|nr:hypothetical protein [Sanguibacter massiliensis]